MSTRRSRREADIPCAVMGALLGVVVLGMLGYGMAMSGLSFGAPSPQDLVQQSEERAEVAHVALWILLIGCALAGGLRLWRTLTTHLVIFGVGTLVLCAMAASR
ncbi:hypothetical protein ACFYM2_08465 [Streptomyces sp. NPDC006711]|uniref:hypothetical protein n=1 Tax=Streptomyces sp. NPDC006711 TaxID=3364762 RepID=UPI0036C9477B